MKIGLISNTLSLRNRAAPLEPPLPTAPVGLLHRPVEGARGLAEALDDFAAAGVGILAVNGGDGTLSAVLTALFETSRFEREPYLALLRGGTLNMCAGDVGLKGRPAAALQRLLARAAAGGLEAAVAERDVIRVRRDGGAPPLCGLFFATGSLYRAVRFSYEQVPGRDRSPRRHAARTFAALIGRYLRRSGSVDEVVRSDRVSIALDAGPAEPLELLLALVTTLDHLVFNIRPYWGREDGALRYTALTYPPDRLLRRAPRVLYGGPERGLPPESYRSHNSELVTLEPGLPFALDGQLYDMAAGGRLDLEAAGRVRFLRC